MFDINYINFIKSKLKIMCILYQDLLKETFSLKVIRNKPIMIEITKIHSYFTVPKINIV